MGGVMEKGLELWNQGAFSILHFIILFGGSQGIPQPMWNAVKLLAYIMAAVFKFCCVDMTDVTFPKQDRWGKASFSRWYLEILIPQLVQENPNLI